MKTKKYFVLLIAVIMLVTIIPVSVFAVEGNGSQSQPAQIKCTPKINGEEYYGDCKYIKRGYDSFDKKLNTLGANIIEKK